jgi:hypothetical protein
MLLKGNLGYICLYCQNSDSGALGGTKGGERLAENVMRKGLDRSTDTHATPGLVLRRYNNESRIVVILLNH